MHQQYIAAVIQPYTSDDIDANLNSLSSQIRYAAQTGAKLAALPETSNVIYPRTRQIDSDVIRENADRTIRFLSDQAREFHIVIHGGSIHRPIPGERRNRNSSLLFDDQGALVASYDKIHTFDITLPNGKQVRESDNVRPGNSVTVTDTPLGRFGFAICYDVRFPELYRTMALQGADIIFNPANFAVSTGRDHWEPLLRARAIENSCYVVAAAQCGDNARMNSNGNSMIVDPWGTVLARCGNEPSVAFATIDLNHLQTIRDRMQTLENRRTDIYRLPVDAEISHKGEHHGER